MVLSKWWFARTKSPKITHQNIQAYSTCSECIPLESIPSPRIPVTTRIILVRDPNLNPHILMNSSPFSVGKYIFIHLGFSSPSHVLHQQTHSAKRPSCVPYFCGHSSIKGAAMPLSAARAKRGSSSTASISPTFVDPGGSWRILLEDVLSPETYPIPKKDHVQKKWKKCWRQRANRPSKQQTLHLDMNKKSETAKKLCMCWYKVTSPSLEWYSFYTLNIYGLGGHVHICVIQKPNGLGIRENQPTFIIHHQPLETRHHT